MEETVEEAPMTVTLDYDTNIEDEEGVYSLDTSEYFTYDENGNIKFDSEAYQKLLEEAKVYGYDYDDLDDVETYTEYTPSTGTVTVTTANNPAVAAAVTAVMGMMWVIILVSIAFGVYTAIVNYKISRKMGREAWFGVLAIFFWPIMSGILAFSKDKKPIQSAEALLPSDITPEPSPVPDFSKPAETAAPEKPAETTEEASSEKPAEPENPQPEM